MYKNMTELFSDSEGKGAVGAFNVHCFEMVPAMVRAAEEMEMPIILQTSLGTAQYIGFGPLVAAIKALADKSSIDVALHMDHCKSVEALKKAIDCGYSSVMYDGSSLALEENIRNTQEVVDYAHEMCLWKERWDSLAVRRRVWWYPRMRLCIPGRRMRCILPKGLRWMHWRFPSELLMDSTNPRRRLIMNYWEN